MATSRHQPTPRQLQQLREDNARQRKAHDAVDAIFYLIDHGAGIGPWTHDTLDRLDDGGWDTLAQLIGRRPDQLRSAETRAMVRELYRHKLERRREYAAMTLDQLFDLDSEDM